MSISPSEILAPQQVYELFVRLSVNDAVSRGGFGLYCFRCKSHEVAVRCDGLDVWVKCTVCEQELML